MAIHQVRNARRYKDLASPIEHVAQKTKAYGGATQTAEPLTVPKKKGAWDTYPTTPTPQGNESPHRGEAPRLTKKAD